MTVEPSTEPISPIDIFPVLGEDFGPRVVQRALKHHSGSGASCPHLRAALRRLQVDGYRDAGLAPRAKLVEPVTKAIRRRRDEDVARAVLNAWMASHGELRDRTTEHLASRGMSVPEPREARFDAFWTFKEWWSECDGLVAADGNADPESAALMICLLLRRFPSPPQVGSPLFRGWLDTLRDLPPGAPDWQEVDVLVKWMEDLRCANERELLRLSRKEIARTCSSLSERFGEELRYLAVDPAPWPGLVRDRPTLAGDALSFLGFLETSLEAYGPIRPQAPSRAEEIERSVKRGECEDAILAEVGAWQDRLARPDPPAESVSGPGAGAAGEPHVASGAKDAGGAKPEPASGASGDEDGPVLRELAGLRDDCARLEEDNRALRAEKADRKEEAGRIRAELSQSRRMEEQWRRAYIEERKARRLDGDESAAADPRDVREAIAQAQRMFPGRLLVKLNSRSNEDTPFENPAEVLDALAWLATAYRTRPDEVDRRHVPRLVLQAELVSRHDGTVPGLVPDPRQRNRLEAVGPPRQGNQATTRAARSGSPSPGTGRTNASSSDSSARTSGTGARSGVSTRRGGGGAPARQAACQARRATV